MATCREDASFEDEVIRIGINPRAPREGEAPAEPRFRGAHGSAGASPSHARRLISIGITRPTEFKRRFARARPTSNGLEVAATPASRSSVGANLVFALHPIGQRAKTSFAPTADPAAAPQSRR